MNEFLTILNEKMDWFLLKHGGIYTMITTMTWAILALFGVGLHSINQSVARAEKSDMIIVILAIFLLFALPAIILLVGVVKGMWRAENGKERLTVLLTHVIFLFVGYYLFRVIALIVIIGVFIALFLLYCYLTSNTYITTRRTVVYRSEDEDDE